MAVYVDDMYKSPIGEYRGMKMSHMMADTTEELLEMVDKIGVKRKWIQYPGTPKEHFDICLSKRTLAIRFGAEEISWAEMSQITMARIQAAKTTSDGIRGIQAVSTPKKQEESSRQVQAEES